MGECISTGDKRISTLPYYENWEVPATLNNTWGYKYFDNNWKSPEMLIKLLVKINSIHWICFEMILIMH